MAKTRLRRGPTKIRRNVQQYSEPYLPKIAPGEVAVCGSFAAEHRAEVLNRIRNEEERAKGLNPLERIIELTDHRGIIRVTTTNEKLAQRIGRALHRAYQGAVKYTSGHRIRNTSWWSGPGAGCRKSRQTVRVSGVIREGAEHVAHDGRTCRRCSGL